MADRIKDKSFYAGTTGDLLYISDHPSETEGFETIGDEARAKFKNSLLLRVKDGNSDIPLNYIFAGLMAGIGGVVFAFSSNGTDTIMLNSENAAPASFEERAGTPSYDAYAYSRLEHGTYKDYYTMITQTEDGRTLVYDGQTDNSGDPRFEGQIEWSLMPQSEAQKRLGYMTTQAIRDLVEIRFDAISQLYEEDLILKRTSSVHVTDQIQEAETEDVNAELSEFDALVREGAYGYSFGATDGITIDLNLQTETEAFKRSDIPLYTGAGILSLFTLCGAIGAARAGSTISSARRKIKRNQRLESLKNGR